MIIRCNLSSPEEDVGKSFLMIDVVFFGSYPVRGKAISIRVPHPSPVPIKGKKNSQHDHRGTEKKKKNA